MVLLRQPHLIGSEGSKGALSLVVAVIEPAAVIGGGKLVCVARQYRKGRVCMILQVGFITQLQHSTELQCLNWVIFPIVALCAPTDKF